MRARDYQPGEQVPGTVYRVLRLIGVGGMGTVYDVEDTTIGKRYVLKTLHPKLGAREDLARRIQHEARTLARLNHPNIVEVITAGVTADDLKLPYYLMERLSGQSLRVVLEKKGRLELSHAYHIGIDLLDALDHAHDKGVVHRDVKPDNIFLHRTMAGVTVTKLLDFGIVSMLDASTAETAGRFLGTLRYAAPEQLRGEKPTAKTDVYSAALVIYEIVAGHGPFDDQGDARRVAAAHMSKTPPPVSRFAPGVPKELDSLLGAALAKNQDVRPRDAFSFAASLRNLKRKLQSDRPRENTENRVTVAAVLAPDSSPASGRAEPSDGQFVVSPATPVPTPFVPTSTPANLPKTTLPGMPAPPLEPSQADTTPFTVTTTTPGPIDRSSPTNTMAPDTYDMTHVPEHGTEAMARTPVELPTPPLQWPLERSAIRSLEPQVRSLLPAVPRRAVWSMAAAAVGSAALSLTLGVAVLTRRPAPLKAKAVAPSGAMADAPPPPEPPAPAAPPLQPPPIDLAPAASSSSAVLTPVPVRSAAPSARPVLAAPPPLPKAATARHTMNDRPGPGF
jgi:serine/threonine-protein kinase